MRFILIFFSFILFFTTTYSVESKNFETVLLSFEKEFSQDTSNKLKIYRDSAHFNYSQNEFQKNPELYFERRISALEDLQKFILAERNVNQFAWLLKEIESKKKYLKAVQKTVWDPRATKSDWLNPKRLTMKNSYWHELLDPYHRVGLFADISISHWRVSDCPNYFIFLETLETNASFKRILPFEKRVIYLNSEERAEFELTVKESLFYYQDNLFDTDEFFSIHSGKGKAIFVMDAEGRFFASNHEAQKIHHSTLFEGKDVKGAGELIVKQGRLIKITNKSGHYQPNAKDTVDVLRELTKKLGSLKGIDLDLRTIYDLNSFNLSIITSYDADDFLQHEGNLIPKKTKGASILHDALLRKNYDQLATALYHIKPNSLKGCPVTTLQLAALTDDLEAVKLLISMGADPNFVSMEKKTALHMALEKGHIKIAKFLFKHTKTHKNPFSFAISAAKGGEEGLILALDALQIDPDTIDPKSGKTFFHLLAHSKDGTLLLNYLNENQNSLDFEGASPVHDAAAYGSRKTLLLLLNDQNPSTLLDSYGNSPLHYAVKHCNLETVEYLLERGGLELALLFNQNGTSAFHLAATSLPFTHLQKFIDLGIPVDFQDAEGNTALGHALSYSFYPINVMKNIILLKKCCARDDIFNNKGYLPIHMSIESGSAELFICYLTLIAQYDFLTEDGVNLHDFAAKHSRTDILNVLNAMK